MAFPLTSIASGLVPPERYPPPDRGEVVVWGLLAAYPFGGMTWQVLHHLVGLRRLGFDVWYVEDSDAAVFDVSTYWQTYDVPEHNLCYLADAMAAVGLADRWIYRRPATEVFEGRWDRHQLDAVYARCRAAFNLCGAQELRHDHLGIARLVYLETDPVALQVAVAGGDHERAATLERYHHRFSYGANLGREGCPIPDAPPGWHPTRPPVVVDWWADGPAAPPRGALTSVANWRHQGKAVEWQGVVYEWRKDLAFAPYLELPKRSPLPLELALGALSQEERDELESAGWRTVPSLSVGDPDTYRQFIRGSLGEFSAIKDQYVATRCGWFSDRTVCYLAAGLPVVIQDTGCGTWLPTGEGVLVFNDFDTALGGVEAVAADPDRHRRAAAEVAREYFAAERVLGEVAATVGL